ncbi:helix-turn-helix domain-containing protein [Streptomyces malaysiensis]|uniref:HTH cro/C1-type domain-containing protein n=1 Tax=Streptomyces malaysiensis TaxID=92644 RepID=A0A7X5X4B5_STRMQ|nr:helix-turn-helix transcriptional regulator [Streptomyces malaysiensis]NIY65635.1 hypothetical protein [Streptomyces malaysiensis]
MEILERCIALMRDVEDLTAVAVRQARERGASWEAIGQVAHVSGDSARTRWSPRQVERLLEQRAKRAGHLHAPYPSVVPARDAAAPSVPGSAELPDEEGPPGRQLARALADLHAGSAKSLRRLARDTGVSPSFISRLLSGERRPSWPVAEKFVHACGGDPAELRPKWERACGIDDTSPITEAATLSSMTKAISVMQNAFQRLEHVVPAPIGPLADESAQAGVLPARQIMSISWAPDGHAALLSGRSEELCATWDRLQQSGIRPETSTGNQE